MKKDIAVTKKVFLNINNSKIPFIYIFGNGDDGWYNYPFSHTSMNADKKLIKFMRKSKLFRNINYGQTNFKGISFVGFGGYMDIEAYLDKKVFPDSAEKKKYVIRFNRLKKSRKSFFRRLNSIKNKNKIFVLHYPPMGVFDIIKDKKDNPMNGKSAGVRFFREAIRKYKPLIAFCGHMHEYQGMKKIGRTLVVNPGDAEKGKYAVVEVDVEKGKVRAKFVK